MVLLKLDRITWTWVAPEADPRLLLLTRSRSDDVDAVLIGGEVVLREGMPTRFDMAAAGQTLKETLTDVPASEEMSHLVDVLLPYLEAHL